MIQGGAEMGARLEEDELQHALDFCVHLFDPTTPEQHAHVRAALEGRIFSSHALASSPGGGDEHAEDCAGESMGAPMDGAKLLDVHAPLVDPAKLARALQSMGVAYGVNTAGRGKPAGMPVGVEDAEMRMVLEKVNARRVIHAEHGNGLNSLEEEAVDGFVVRLERGALGLRRAGRGEGQ